MELDKPSIPPGVTLRDILGDDYDRTSLAPIFAELGKSVKLAPIFDHITQMGVPVFPKIDVLSADWAKAFTGQGLLGPGWAAKSSGFATAIARSVDHASSMNGFSAMIAAAATGLPAQAAAVSVSVTAAATSDATATMTVIPPPRFTLTREQVWLFIGLSANLLQVASYIENPDRKHLIILLSVLLFSAAVVYGDTKLEK